MNVKALEGLIDSIVSSYSCESCSKKVQKHDLEIKNIEGNAVTLSIKCPSCGHTTLLKSEVVSIDLTKYLTEEQLELVKNSIDEQNQPKISDEEIVGIHKNLNKKNCSVDDFLQ